MGNGPLGGQLLLQALLIGVNAFFASAEMSVVSLNTNLLKKKADEGDKKAEKKTTKKAADAE